MEIGMGIHGEKGKLRTNVKKAHEIVTLMINEFLEKNLK
jgi:dihydroxyacetone kinase